MGKLTLKPENKETARKFLTAIYGDYFKQNKAFLELITFNHSNCLKHSRGFYPGINEAIKDLDCFQGNIGFRIAPRSKKDGRKEASQAVTCLWIDIDYGIEGHKRQQFKNKNTAGNFIRKLDPEPSIIIHTGNGYHVYWILDQPEKNPEKFPDIELILDGLRGNRADFTSSIQQLFRLPGTFNAKDPGNLKEVKIEKFNPGLKYNLQEFERFKRIAKKTLTAPKVEKNKPLETMFLGDKKPLGLPELKRKGINPVILDLIKNGDTETKYKSESERDQAIIKALCIKRLTPEEIKAVFVNPEFEIADISRKGAYQDNYLALSITKALANIAYEGIEYDTAELKKKMKEVATPAETSKILYHYLGYEEQLTPKDLLTEKDIFPAGLEGYKELEEKHARVYRKQDLQTDGSLRIREYRISKEAEAYLDPGEKIDLDLMRRAYLFSLREMLTAGARERISFNLTEKYSPEKITSRHRQELTKAEKLLFYTEYRSFTKTGRGTTERHSRLYSDLKITDEPGRTIYTIMLNPGYLEQINLETGKVEAPYYQEPLRISDGKTKEERLTNRSLSELNKWGVMPGQAPGKGKAPKRISYLLKTHLKKIGVSERELGRAKDVEEIWRYIEPTFARAGHKITEKKIPPGKDIRDLKLQLQLGERPPARQ